MISTQVRLSLLHLILRSVLVGAALWLVVSMGGCAKTVIQPTYEQQTPGPVLRPSHVLVYDFAVTTADVHENQGFFARTLSLFSDTTADARALAIARDAQTRMSEDLVAGIRELGLPAHRVAPGTPLPSDAIAVTGLFLDVDEGNRLRRTVLGFGAGQSRVDAQVQVSAPAPTGPIRLLEFTTHADSGATPGALAMGGAGAAAQGGITAGMAGANVGVGAVKGYRSQTEQMTARSAAQAVAYLSQYFARHGWIAQEKVKHATIGTP